MNNLSQIIQQYKTSTENGFLLWYISSPTIKKHKKIKTIKIKKT